MLHTTEPHYLRAAELLRERLEGKELDWVVVSGSGLSMVSISVQALLCAASMTQMRYAKRSPSWVLHAITAVASAGRVEPAPIPPTLELTSCAPRPPSD